MNSSWRIVEEVSDNAVNLGFVKAPTVTADESIVKYDYAGNHVDNVSTFPGQSRLVTASYDRSHEAWYLRSLFSTDALITNRIVAQKGIKRTVPLFFVYKTYEPLVSRTAVYDGTSIKGRSKLKSEVEFTSVTGSSISENHFLYDLEFVPYNVHLGVNFNTAYGNLFFIYTYFNPTPNGSTVKIKFTALDRKVPGGKAYPGWQEYLSGDNVLTHFNTNYEYTDGLGSDLMGFSYPHARLNPLYGMDPANPIPVDPDALKGRKDTQYTLLYSHTEKSYLGLLSDSVKSDTTYQTKPAPLFLIYFNGVLEDIDPRDLITIRVENSNIMLELNEPGSTSRAFIFTIKGRATFDVVDEINGSPAPFTAYEGVRIESIDESSLWIEDQSSFIAASGTDQVFDVTMDSGMIIRSTKFITRYTQEPTINALPPVNKATRVPWSPRIKVGGFVNPNGDVFFIDEYSSQQWSGTYGYPWVEVNGEEARFVGHHKIKTSYNRLYNDISSVVLTDANGDSLNSFVDGMDALAGIIFLKDIIKSDSVFISYAYKERYFEYNGLNMNPTEPYNSPLGKYQAIFVRPYLRGQQINRSTIGHATLDSLPSSNYIEGNLILAVLLLVDKFEMDLDYKLSTTSSAGGGIKTSLTLDEREQKVPDDLSLFDSGFNDGLRYPGNSAIHYAFPRFMEGNETIVIGTYYPDSVTNQQLKIYGASKIPPGTELRVWYNQLGVDPEIVSVQGMLTHDTVRLVTPLTNIVHIGARVTFPTNMPRLFSHEELKEIIRKFSTAGSTHIIEYS